jgi:hypothetical protein
MISKHHLDYLNININYKYILKDFDDEEELKLSLKVGFYTD